MSWSQISLVAECIVTHKAETFNAYAAPVAEALGGKNSKPAKPKRRTGIDKDKDQRRIDAIVNSGFFVD